MKIVAISDLHGYLPTIPKCDLLLIAGDICPVWDHRVEFQAKWLRTEFNEWLNAVPAEKVIGVWGNHDWIGQKNPELVPKLRWTLLTDESTTYHGLNIYGTPWQRRFHDWAFNLDEPELAEKYKAIPGNTNILVCHGPPYSFGDRVESGELCGSPSLLRRIGDIMPNLVVFGHIHTQPGQWSWGQTKLANVSILTDSYQFTGNIQTFEIEGNPFRHGFQDAMDDKPFKAPYDQGSSEEWWGYKVGYDDGVSVRNLK